MKIDLTHIADISRIHFALEFARRNLGPECADVIKQVIPLVGRLERAMLMEIDISGKEHETREIADPIGQEKNDTEAERAIPTPISSRTDACTESSLSVPG